MSETALAPSLPESTPRGLPLGTRAGDQRDASDPTLLPPEAPLAMPAQSFSAPV